MKGNRVEQLALKDQLEHTLEEARVVLPGIQALFGFQLIAVFNQSFRENLSQGEQRLHLLAIGSSALAIALTMSPTALHRQALPDSVSSRLVKMCTVLLTAGMMPLLAGISLDFYLMCRLILNDADLSRNLAVALALLLVAAWYVMPSALRAWLCSDSEGGAA